MLEAPGPVDGAGRGNGENMDIAKAAVTIQAADGTMPAFLAKPDAPGVYPGVVVVMEAFGLNNHIRRVAERIAAEGYVALAPDLYYREEKRVAAYADLPGALALMNTLWDERVVADMGSAVAYLQSLSQVAGERIGAVGFCMGGRIVFLTACLNLALRAVAVFYGGGIAWVATPSERTPRAPLEYADRLAAPVLLLFGEDDPFIPLEDVHRVRRRLSELGKRAEVVVYPRAPHGFFCDERASYRPEAASDAWNRLCRFFGAHLRRHESSAGG